jgi:hypothetical protein
VTPGTLLDLIVGATGLSGLLAGASADRYLVRVPAWRRLDPMTWAEHSRHADLGNGRFWYPILASAARLGYARSAAFGERRWSSAAMLKRPLRWIACLGCITSCSHSVGSTMTGVDAQGLADGDGSGDEMGRV